MAGFTGIANGVKYGAIGLIIILPVLVFIFFIVLMKKYNNTIILRTKTRGVTDIVTQDKFKIQKKKHEPECIRTLKTRLTLHYPPPQALDIKQNGKLHAEAYINETGEATYINITTEKTPALISSDDKSFYFSETQKSKAKYNKPNIWSFLNQHAGALIMIIFVFMIFLFWSDIMAPVTAISSQNAQAAEKWNEVIIRLDRMINDKQTIAQERIYNISGVGN